MAIKRSSSKASLIRNSKLHNTHNVAYCEPTRVLRSIQFARFCFGSQHGTQELCCNEFEVKAAICAMLLAVAPSITSIKQKLMPMLRNPLDSARRHSATSQLSALCATLMAARGTTPHGQTRHRRAWPSCGEGRTAWSVRISVHRGARARSDRAGSLDGIAGFAQCQMRPFGSGLRPKRHQASRHSRDFSCGADLAPTDSQQLL